MEAHLATIQALPADNVVILRKLFDLLGTLGDNKQYTTMDHKYDSAARAMRSSSHALRTKCADTEDACLHFLRTEGRWPTFSDPRCCGRSRTLKTP